MRTWTPELMEAYVAVEDPEPDRKRKVLPTASQWCDGCNVGWDAVGLDACWLCGDRGRKGWFAVAQTHEPRAVWAHLSHRLSPDDPDGEPVIMAAWWI